MRFFLLVLMSVVVFSVSFLAAAKEPLSVFTAPAVEQVCALSGGRVASAKEVVRFLEVQGQIDPTWRERYVWARNLNGQFMAIQVPGFRAARLDGEATELDQYVGLCVFPNGRIEVAR
ncbi:MAG: hypothetical protein WCW27_06050 [Patescibacteria group bacterium]|jgi:hypothetical protein